MKKIRRKRVYEEIIDEAGNILEKRTLEELMLGYANISACANYLIRFFFKTDKKYSCTRTKIEKLLSILAFRYASKGITLFDGSIYWDRSTTVMRELVLFYTFDIYDQKRTMADENKIIAPHELKEENDVDIPDVYMVRAIISDEVTKDIEVLFYNFGAYSSYDLTMLLKPIVEYEGVCRADSSIDLEAIARLDKNQFPDNKVVEFIFKE